LAGNTILDDMVGPRKAALMLRAIGEDRARRLMSMMNAEEMRKLTEAMDKVGVVEAGDLEAFFDDFAGRVQIQPVKKAAAAQPRPQTLDIDISGGTTEDAPKAVPNLTDFSA